MEYGLIGEKLGHSFSKEIHGMIGDYSYELKEIAKPDLTAFMQEKAFKGIKSKYKINKVKTKKQK